MPTSADRSTDTPLTNPGHDDFQRAPFSERLAQILLTSTHSASSVVGLYGKWGEGKSTVLHFIEHYLLNANPAPIILHLNPWRFPDESQLLLDFFKQLTKALGQSLHGTGEKIAEAVTKYVAPLIPKMGFAGFTSDPGSTLQAIGNIAQPSIEELHRRVDQAIAESGKRVVVFIDDIDRLEKTQIQSVFRLVKLTANFRQTAYLLAFDDVMVARAIGETFAAGADATSADALTAGQNFLEKIVQVPLRLPRARQQDLWQYCRARTQEALHEAQTELDSQEAQRTGQALNAQRFDNALRRGILPRLTTPRLAIRYANAIRFSLPLLRGEVNTVDLLLVEALNIFYPELHQFVAARQDHFAGDGEKRQVVLSFGNTDEPDINTQLEGLLQTFNYTGETAAAAKALLTNLFPRLTATTSPWFWSDSNTPTTEAELNRRQSVAAPAYFSRYFSYSIARGDVSDQEFNTFVQCSASEQITYFRDFIQRIGVSITLQRLEYRLPDLTVDQSRALFNTLTQAADVYISDHNDMFGHGEVPQVGRLLTQLLDKLPDASERQDLATQLVQERGTFKLAYEFDQRLQMRREAETRISTFGEPSGVQPLLSAEAWEQLLNSNPRRLLERALREAGSEPLYRTHPERALKLLALFWPRQQDLPPGPADYVFNFLDRHPDEVNDFLEVSSQRIHSGRVYWGGLSIDQFDLLRTVFGQRLYDLARIQFGNEPVTGVDFTDPDQPTPRQRLQQFIWLYENRPLPSAQAE